MSISRLYGKHEQLLNDLVWRYDNNLISDLFEYFKEPWASILYHDRFNNFLNQIFPLFKNIKVTALYYLWFDNRFVKAHEVLNFPTSFPLCPSNIRNKNISQLFSLIKYNCYCLKLGVSHIFTLTHKNLIGIY